MAAIGNVIWKESDELKEGQIRIQKCNDGEDYRYGQKRDKLKILPETYPQGIMNSIIILVPKGNWFKELYVEVSAGGGDFSGIKGIRDHGSSYTGGSAGAGGKGRSD